MQQFNSKTQLGNRHSFVVRTNRSNFRAAFFLTIKILFAALATFSVVNAWSMSKENIKLLDQAQRAAASELKQLRLNAKIQSIEHLARIADTAASTISDESSSTLIDSPEVAPCQESTYAKTSQPEGSSSKLTTLVTLEKELLARYK